MLFYNQAFLHDDDCYLQNLFHDDISIFRIAQRFFMQRKIWFSGMKNEN